MKLSTGDKAQTEAFPLTIPMVPAHLLARCGERRFQEQARVSSVELVEFSSRDFCYETRVRLTW